MRRNPERFAWLVVLISFGAFCTICTGSILLVRWFVFESTVSLPVELEVSRNTVGVLVNGRAEETERGTRTIDGRVTLTTDSTSQAILTFRDPETGGVIATFTLFRDSVVILSRADRPRFDTDDKPYTIEIIGQRGHGDVNIPAGLDLPVQFRVLTVYDAVIRMDERGYYTIALGGDHVGVTTRVGEATVHFGEDLVEHVAPGYRANVPGSMPDQPIEVVQSALNLVYNSGFVLYAPPSEGVTPLPAEWGCYNDQDDPYEPRGQSVRTTFDDRPVLHIYREGDYINHAETGCRQPYDNLDLSDYSRVELRATFNIQSQNISTCGVEGSECPLMIRIKYEDKEGEEHEWIHGFYSAYTMPEWPLTCPSCRQDHDRVRSGVWHTFESGNLADILPDEVKMHTLKEIRFYASGHAYDVFVDEVSLLATP